MDEVLAAINGSGRLEDVSEIREFQGYRNGAAVTIRVFDRGAPDQHRYHVEAFYSHLPESERSMARPGYSFGNPGATIEEALDNVHWWEFDSDN